MANETLTQTDLQKLLEALDRCDQELTVPAAEYVPAIPAAWEHVKAAKAAARALKARVEELEVALKPFALVAEHDIGSDETDRDKFRPISRNRAPLLTVGDLRRARAALQPEAV